MIDPLIEDIGSHWKLWVLGKQPLFRLAWDPTDYQWTYPFTGNNINFFPIFYTIGKTCVCRIDGMRYQLQILESIGYYFEIS